METLKLTPNEIMETFLEGAHELTWTIADGGYLAENPITNIVLTIRRQEQTDVEFLTLKQIITYELSLRIQDNGVKYTYVRTGDYDQKCDKLLKSLYRHAQQFAQTNLMGMT